MQLKVKDLKKALRYGNHERRTASKLIIKLYKCTTRIISIVKHLPLCVEILVISEQI